jgi:hypothetical protein
MRSIYSRIGRRVRLGIQNSTLRQSNLGKLALLVCVSVATSLILLVTSGTALAHLGASTKHSPHSPPSQELVNKVNVAIKAVEDLSLGNFVNPNRGKTLVNQLEAVLNKIEAGNIHGAKNSIEHSILPKIDGCALRGSPDRDDWINNCSAQNAVYSAITSLTASLSR